MADQLSLCLSIPPPGVEEPDGNTPKALQYHQIVTLFPYFGHSFHHLHPALGSISARLGPATRREDVKAF